jgi:hypothetical protein
LGAPLKIERPRSKLGAPLKIGGLSMPQRQTPTRQPGDGDGHARAFSDSSKSRMERLEAAIESIQQTLDVQFKRMAAMQAEIDLLRAKRRSS